MLSHGGCASPCDDASGYGSLSSAHRSTATNAVAVPPAVDYRSIILSEGLRALDINSPPKSNQRLPSFYLFLAATARF
jgi:hypothetical protein